jgi:hypothetical protein
MVVLSYGCVKSHGAPVCRRPERCANSLGMFINQTLAQHLLRAGVTAK